MDSTTAIDPALRVEALEALRVLTGRSDATFHDGQFEAISALVADRRRVLVVQRTGWGKSAVYFLAALLQRRRGAGPALIISPLIALMRDQVAAARRAGVRAQAISSANATEWGDIEQALARDELDVLLVSPERLVNPRFRDEQLPRLVENCGLLVIDEAHCISDWGHDFRPDYRRLRDLVGRLGPQTPVLATTATANSRVVADVAEQLETSGNRTAENSGSSASAPPREGTAGVLTLRGALTRESLRLGCLSLGDDRARLEYLLEHVDDLSGSGIIYTLTVSAAEDVAALLDRPGRPVRAYTGRTDAEDRAALEQALKNNEVKALAATSALGMGFDKPDLGFVVHLGAPSSPVAYYQQVGRAGRATDSADVLLLPGREDRAIWEYFATASMPSKEAADAVLDALDSASGPLSTPALEARVDVRRTALDLLLKVLAVDGAVENVTGGWVSTGTGWEYDSERYENVARARREEQQAMLAYERLGGGGSSENTPNADPEQCRMVFLARQLDDDTATACGRCDVCAGPWYPVPGLTGHRGNTSQRRGDPASARDSTGAAHPVSAEVAALLDRVGVPVSPRAQWPQGLDRVGVRENGAGTPKGRIPEQERAEEGRVVARLSDLGWAGVLRELLRSDEDGRRIDGPVPPELGRRIVDVLAAWDWQERPAAIVAVPSATRPQLVASVATGIAAVGRLPYLGTLDLTPGAGPLRSGGNSAFRVADLWERFHVGAELAQRLHGLSGAPILLVDDTISSRWTMTIAARLLRRAGSGPVLPLALALEG